jgi:hypothetical protein
MKIKGGNHTLIIYNQGHIFIFLVQLIRRSNNFLRMVVTVSTL